MTPPRVEAPGAGGQDAGAEENIEHTPRDAASFCKTSAVTVVRADDLTALPAQIDAAIQDVKFHATGMVQAAERVGQLLLRAKAGVPHGAWDNWLRTNCSVAPRTAQAYMRLSRRLSELTPGMRNAVADLPLREAFKAITTRPNFPLPNAGTQFSIEDAEARRISDSLHAASSAIKAVARSVINLPRLRRDAIERARTKLLAAVAKLDRLLALVDRESGT